MARQWLDVQGKEELLKGIAKTEAQWKELLALSPGNQASCHPNQLPAQPPSSASSGQTNSGQPSSI